MDWDQPHPQIHNNDQSRREEANNFLPGLLSIPNNNFVEVGMNTWSQYSIKLTTLLFYPNIQIKTLYHMTQKHLYTEIYGWIQKSPNNLPTRPGFWQWHTHMYISHHYFLLIQICNKLIIMTFQLARKMYIPTHIHSH